MLEFFLFQTNYFQGIQDEPFVPLAQAIKLIRFFIPATDKNFESLQPEEQNIFKLFTFQTLVLIIERVFLQEFSQ